MHGKLMRRKVIKQGHNTLTITLPNKWVKRYSIKAGDEVNLDEQGKTLIVAAEQQKIPSKTVVDVTGLTIPLLWRNVISAYRAGFDEIKIVFDQTKDYKDLYTAFSYNTLQYLNGHDSELTPVEAIQALVNRFIGVEVIDQQRNYCIVKALGETNYKEFDNALRRIFLLLLHLAEETVKAIEKKDYKMLKSVHMIDTNIDRFEDFCLRVLNRQGYVNYKKTPAMYSLIFLFELIGDEFKKLAIHILEAKKIRKDLLQLFKTQEKQLRRFYELFYGFNKQKLLEIYTEEKISNQIKEYDKLNNDEKEIIHHLKKIGSYILSMTELRIDLEY